MWGYNDNVNEPPLTRDPVQIEHPTPPFKTRMAFLALFLTFLGIAILIAKLT